ncbi:MAG: sigma-70 family RNA polymerase sigma factor [Planctomycetota bacterium]
MQWVTTTQILDDLKFSDNSNAWKTFTDHFYPVIFAFAKSMGLSAADAEDAAQETILQFLRLYRDNRFQREKGHLSHWIFGVARNVIRDFIKKRPKEYHISDNGSRTSYWDSIQDDKSTLHTWTTEWQRIVLSRCLIRVRSEVDKKTYRAFEMYAIAQQPVQQVCGQLDMTANAVYIAKNRVLTKIREFKEHYDE